MGGVEAGLERFPISFEGAGSGKIPTMVPGGKVAGRFEGSLGERKVADKVAYRKELCPQHTALAVGDIT